MIGTSFFIGDNAQFISSEGLINELWHKKEYVYYSDTIQILYTFYEGYPIRSWRNGDNFIVLEGAIYNISDENINSAINNISTSNTYKSDILNFIQEADGEFCITIFNESSQKFIVFNDLLGGLPFFYSFAKGRIICSRSFSFIASNITKINWNSNAIAEYLTFQFNLRDKTFCNEIKKLEPASLLVIENGDLHSHKLYIDNFKLTNRYKNKKEAIEDLSRLFLLSCKNRINYALSHGYKIVNTMSGGFDSRTILGGIENYCQDYDNITYEYIQDESEIARCLLETLNSKSKYKKLQFINSVNLYDSRLAFNTGGRVNAFTNSVCYNDMKMVRNEYGDQRILYFGGFGGEFIRHPYLPSFVPFNKLGYAKNSSYLMTSKLCNTTDSTLSTIFKKSFESNRSCESKYKDFYNEYYQNLVRCSGEDRTRMFYYTVQPMMAKDFVLAIRHRVPLSWVGFNFYFDFLRCIDERLLMVKIFGRPDNYLTHKGLAKEDFRRRHIHKYTHFLHYLLNKYAKWDYKIKECKVDRDKIEKLLTSKACQTIFNTSFIKNNYQFFDTDLQYSLVEILMLINKFDTNSYGEL